MEVEVFKGRAEELRLIAQVWHKECHNDEIEINIDKHLADLQNLIDSEESDLLVISDKGPIGYMGLTVFENPVGSELFANEHYWYILPNKRGGMGAVRLLHAAKQWAMDRNCKFLLMTASKLASDLHDNICKLYERLGFKHFETTYITGVK